MKKNWSFDQKYMQISRAISFNSNICTRQKGFSKSTIVLERGGVTKTWVKTNVLFPYSFLKLLHLLNNFYNKWLSLLDRWRINKALYMITESKTRLDYIGFIHQALDFPLCGNATSQNPIKDESFIEENYLVPINRKHLWLSKLFFMWASTTDC